MDTVKNSILIVGGGIGGLAAALACAEKGAKPVVIERTAQFSEVGAGVQMGPNVTRTLFSWGLEKALQSVVFVPQKLQVKDSQSGNSLGTLPLGPRSVEAYGAPYVTAHRADLHQVLLQKVESSGATELRLNCEIESVHDSANGLSLTRQDLTSGLVESSQAEALVGADGLWSSVRNYVLPPMPPRQTGMVAYRALLPMQALPEKIRSQDVTVWVGPSLHAVLYPVRGGESLNVVVIVQALPPASLSDWDHAANKHDLMQSLGAIHPEFNEILEAVPAWRLWPLCDRPPLSGAHQMAKGHVALLGDAAHPMRPFLAQGAGMAIEDAATLAQCWSRLDLPLAQRWQSYAQMRWARNAKVQKRAIRNGQIFHMKGPMRWGRDLAMRLMGASLMDVPWLYAGP
jgi:salicylate hydroxylase